MQLASKILSDITVYMKYAKYQQDLGRRETWGELVTRNKEKHIKKFRRIFNFLFPITFTQGSFVGKI